MVTDTASENLTTPVGRFNRLTGNIGYMSELGKNIGRRIRQLNTTQTEVAKRAKVSHVLISRLVSGSVKTTGKLAEIAHALDLEVEDLVSGNFHDVHTDADLVKGASPGTDSNVIPAYFKQQKLYPVLNWVQAGEFTEAVDLYAPGYAEEWESTDANVSEHAFWLRVKGDSMTAPTGFSPSIPHGHLILVDPEIPAENGSLVVAKLDSSDEATFKKLVFDGDDKYLKPLNPAYRTIAINGNCRIVGVVTEAKVKL